MGITWDFSEQAAGIQELAPRTMIALKMYADTAAVMLEAKAKQNAPWKDRTSMARRSLNCRASIKEQDTIRLSLAHGVGYGVFLELAHEKKYAILWPTIVSEKNGVVSGMRGLLKSIGKVTG